MAFRLITEGHFYFQLHLKISSVTMFTVQSVGSINEMNTMNTMNTYERVNIVNMCEHKQIHIYKLKRVYGLG
ncbi:hypothetical protein [Dyadobacter sediminis]|uniref:Uncharacterized protein n=1 Tax=Dyadobacter sediminis TaxID=1493691 RepID=A0A5R9KAU8_9BACT|nr:hypothetical protein [Dyadobacter sediminis]TLU91940.1 hypothetical protein FEM55_14335 [Dyadobacter sediminis]